MQVCILTRTPNSIIYNLNLVNELLVALLFVHFEGSMVTPEYQLHNPLTGPNKLTENPCSKIWDGTCQQMRAKEYNFFHKQEKKKSWKKETRFCEAAKTHLYKS